MRIKPPTAYAAATNVWKDNGSGVGSFAAVAYSEVTGTPTLGSAAYVNLSAFLQPSNNLSDLANAATARTNLGLATVASTGSYNDLSSKPDLTVYATLASPAFTGNPTAPTQTAGDSSTKIANTAFVATAINTVLAAAPNKASVKYATTAALAANTYANGSSGVGATLTANSNGALTVDASSPALNDPILVRNEATTANNGIYTLTQLGDGSHPYILTRRTDFDQSTEVFAGDATFVTSGSTLASTTWCMITAGTITIGSTAITWTQTAGPGSYIAGTGLTLAGTTFSVNASQTQITAVGTLSTGVWNGTPVGATYGGTGVNNGSSTLTLNASNSVSSWTVSNAVAAATVDGVLYSTTTAAVNNTQAYSPAAHFQASGYKTTATAGPVTCDPWIKAIPVQGTTAPTSNLAFSSRVGAGAETIDWQFGPSLIQCPNVSSFSLKGSSTASLSYQLGSGQAGVYSASTNGMLIGTGGDAILTIGNTIDATAKSFNVYIPASNQIQYGGKDANAPSAQTFSVAGVAGGTTNTNVAGALITYTDSAGTGTAASGGYQWNVAPVGSTGVNQNAQQKVAALLGGLNYGSFRIYNSAGTPNVIIYGLNQGGIQLNGGSCAFTPDAANNLTVTSISLILSNSSGGTTVKVSCPANNKLQFGGADAASPVAQTISFQNVITATSNIAGANSTFDASQGTGTGNSGSHIFRVAPASTTGSTPNTLVASVTIAATGTTIAQPINISGSPTAFTVTGAAHTSLATTVEDIGVNLNMSATKTWVAGTVATQREVLIQAPTYTCGSAMTITKAGTFVVSGAPIAAGSVTITNPYAFWIQAGASQFDGNVTITGQATLTPQALTSTSASIAWNAVNGNNAQHTATENTTLANPTNLVNGTVYTFAWTQHASAAKTLAFGSKWAFGSGSSTVSVTVGSVQIFTGIYNSTADKIYTVMTGPF